MASVLHRITLEYRKSVNTPAFDSKEWIVNPDLSAVANVPPRYWKVHGDTVLQMTGVEKAVVDDTEFVEYKIAKLNTLRQTAIERGAEKTAEYKTAKNKVKAAKDKATVDAVTLEEVKV